MVKLEFATQKHALPSGVEHGVYAVAPLSGGDAALLAVFEDSTAADELAQFLNKLRDLINRTMDG